MPLEWNKPSVEDVMQLGYEAFLPSMPEEPRTLDVAAATFRLENPVASWMESLHFKSAEADLEGYNPYIDLDEKYLPYSDAFLEVRSPDQRVMKEAQIDSQIRDRQTMARGGGESIAWSLAAGLGDPINLPLMLMPAIRIGAGIGETAALIGAMGAVEAGISEAALHATQPTRTWQETLAAVGATTLLGGSLGGLAGAGTKRTIKALNETTKDIEDIVKNGGLRELPSGSVGAARVVGTLEEEGTTGLGFAFNPLIRLLRSGSATARHAVNEIARHNFYSGKNVNGRESSIPVDVEVTRMQQGMSAKYLRTLQESYKEMLGARTFVGARRLARGMKYRDFVEEVGKAMRRGDAHEVPQIAAAAKKLRTDVINPITRGFQELGDLAENLEAKFARSYLPRVYDVRAIERNMDNWLEMLTVHFTGKDTDALTARAIAQDVTESIMGSPTGRMPQDLVGSTGRLKERVLGIQDDVLDAQGFLINNVDQVLQTYMRSTVPELQLKLRFGEHEMADILRRVKDDYEVLVDAAPSNKKRKALAKQRDSDVKDIAAMRDILLGRYLQPVGRRGQLTNMMRTVRGLSFMANLGMMTVSAIPDIARPVMQHGISAWVKALPRGFLYFAKSTKLARRDLEEMGIGVDNLLNSRIYAMAEIDEIGTGMQKWTQTFARYSGMNHWNSAWKKMAAFTAQNRFINDSMSYATLPLKRQQRLAKAGINEGMAKRIGKESAAHGEKLGGSWHANTADWTDREAAGLFERVLLKDVDNTIVTPGVADRPLFMSTEAGKTILQFRTFFLAAHNQVFLPLGQQLARADMAALEGIIMGVSLGMMGEWIRLNIAGRGDELESYSMMDWARAGLDRSGLVTVPMEGFNMADRMLNGRLSQGMGISEGSRYFYRNWFGTLGGPAVGYVSDIGQMTQNLIDGDGLSSKDIHTMRRLMPYQNIFYMRHLFNELEKEAKRQAGVKRPTRKRRKKSKTVYIQ